MRLLEVTKQRLETLNESGSMSGVGAIHIDEIEPTLDYLEKSLGMDLKNNVLGSVGKKEFSGDIDVAIDVEPEAIPELLDKLKTNPDIIDIAKTSVIITKVKIANYDANKTTDKARTGYVQLDFMPGNPGWMKTYYHSPADGESLYKGVYRNIMLATIAALYNRKDSEEKVEDGRSLESEQYLFSPTKGFSFVRIFQRCPIFSEECFAEAVEDPSLVQLIEHENGLEVPESGTRLYKNKVTHDPSNLVQAMAVANQTDVLPIGLLYQNEDMPIYNDYSSVGIHATPEDKMNALNYQLDRFAI